MATWDLSHSENHILICNSSNFNPSATSRQYDMFPALKLSCLTRPTTKTTLVLVWMYGHELVKSLSYK